MGPESSLHGSAESLDNDHEVVAADPNLIQRNGSHDPENPKLWPEKRKWAVTFSGKTLLHTEEGRSLRQREEVN